MPLYVKQSSGCSRIDKNYDSDIQSLKNKTSIYITQSGVSGIWSYRKYSNGEVEFWGTSVQSVTTTIQQGNIWYSSVFTVNYPFTISNSNKYGFVEAYDVWYLAKIAGISTTSISFRAMRGSSSSTAFNTAFFLFCKGSIA